MIATGYLTSDEANTLAAFAQGNIMEDDRNHFGTGPRRGGTDAYVLDPKITYAVKLGEKLNELGRLTSDDIVEIACLPEPEIPGNAFNATARRKISTFLLDVHNRVRAERNVHH